jgi:hypothetical protein
VKLSKSARQKLLLAAALIAVAVVGFVYGAIVVQYHVFPYELLVALKRSTGSTAVTSPEYVGSQELLRYAFTDSLIRPEDQISPPVSTIEEVASAVDRLHVDVSRFPNGYRDLQVKSAQTHGGILAVGFELEEEHTAYSYVCGDRGTDLRSTAALIIPGSGQNQSTAIAERTLGNYHGDIVGALLPRCDVYVFIKPNEDILAIHNGEAKLSYKFIINELINSGSSYSVVYLIQALATMKYLKSVYDQTVVIGLSQGGKASLLVSMQSDPTLAVIASGYTALPTWGAGFGQILIPGVNETFLDPDVVASRLAAQETRYLFCYGRDEVGAYKIEAEEQYVCRKLSSLENVECVVHEGGHEFPLGVIQDFVDRWTSPNTGSGSRGVDGD